MVVSRTFPLLASLAAAILLAIAVAVVVTLERAQAASPGENGKIAYFSEGTSQGEWFIYTMDPDGSHKRKLIRAQDVDIYDAGSWSPDGKKLAFVRFVSGSNQSYSRDIFVLNTVTQQVRQLTSTPAEDLSPSWSPDGNRIAFSREWNDIYTIKTDGTGLRKLTDAPGAHTDPVWSPDGSKIAFHKWTPRVDDIFVIDAGDGSQQTNLTRTPQGGYENNPDWSPDGQKIAFSRYLCSHNSNCTDIFVMNATDGSGQTNLTQTPDTGDEQPAWSPNGKRIAFTHYGPGLTNADIYTMNADNGNDLKRLTNNTRDVDDLSPAWQPIPAPTAPEGCTISGTNGSDALQGTSANDVICGLGGDDAIAGRGGDDILRGGPGDDGIQGGSGTDKLFGEKGVDGLNTTDGVQSNDAMNGGGGTDSCRGDQGDTRTSCEASQLGG